MFGLIAFGLFIGLIWLEIIVFGIIGSEIGVLLTIIGVFVTAAIGIRLFKSSGRATMARMAASVQAGRPPVLDVADGMAIMLGAGLLLIPGYATDALGFILFIPGLRIAVIMGLYTILKPIMPKFRPNMGKASGFQFYQNFNEQNFNGDHFKNSGVGPNSDQDAEHPFKKTNPSGTNHLGDAPSGHIIEGDYERKDKD